MSTTAMKKLIDAYNQMAPVSKFFMGMFGGNGVKYHNTETFEIDVERSDEDVAVVVQDLSAGYRSNTQDRYVNKEFKPPVFKESTTLNVYDLFKRDPGENPFSDPAFQSKAIARAFKAFVTLEQKIQRAIELQCSQVLQTGKADLKNETGVTLYTIDYKSKTTHLVTVANPWSDTSLGNPIADITALGRVIRADSLMNPDQLIFGVTAWLEFQNHPKVQAILNANLRIDAGAIDRMQKRSNGGNYFGTLTIGAYTYELWTYEGMYKDPQTGNKLDYMGAEKVILRSSKARMDMNYGAVPTIIPPDSRVLPYLPSRVSSDGAGRDLFMNAWVDGPGENLSAGIACRPLAVPVAIDSFGVLST